MSSGIYKIENLVNGKIYIGSATYLPKRWSTHKCMLKQGVHSNAHLQRAWTKYGEKAFRFCVVERVKVAKQLIAREQYWLDKLESYDPDKGYNIRRVAQSNLGIKTGPRTEAAKQQMSESSKGQIPWNTGKKRTVACRKKIGDSLRKRAEDGIPGAFTGKNHTVKSRKQMSEAHTGKECTATHRENVSKALTGRIFTEEHCRNLSIARKKYFADKKAKSNGG